MNNIRKLNSTSLILISIYLVFEEKIFLYLAVFSLFVSLNENKLSHLTVSALDTIMSYVKKGIFILIIFMAYYFVVIFFAFLWKLINKKKKKYYFDFKNQETTLIDYKEAPHYLPW